VAVEDFNRALTGGGAVPGRLTATKAGANTGQPAWAGLLGRLINPLVDLPDQENPLLRFLERGVEEASSPVGLATAALVPFTGGTSLALPGLLGTAARVGTRAGAEIAISAVSTKAAEKANELDLPGPLGTIATLGAGVAAGNIVARPIARAGAKTRLQQLKEFDSGRTIKDYTTAEDRLGFLLRNATLVTGDRAASVVGNATSSRARFADMLQQGGFDKNAYAAARDSLSNQPRNVRFAPAGITQPSALRTPDAMLTGTDIRDMLRTIKRNVPNKFDQLKTAAILEDITARGVKPSGTEIRHLKAAFGDDLVASLMGLQTKSEGFKQFFFDSIGLPRTLMASIDLSAPLRQGIMAAPNHPIAFAKSIIPMMRSWGNEDYARRVLDDLTLHPSYDNAVKSGVEFTGFSGHSFVKSEEQFGNRILENQLGRTLLGQGVKASERAYSVFLNKLRMDVFHSISKNWDGTAKATPKNYEDLGKFVNNMTGRAKLPGNLGDSSLLNAAFFAPRFLYSRFAAPMQLATASPVMRNQIARELAVFVGTGSMVLYLAKKNGADVEIDPRSSDFGKIKVGNTRYDFWGGYSQIARAVAQTATGQYKSTSTGEIKDTNRAVAVGRFFQSKLSPVPGLGVDVARGENFLGEEVRGDQKTVTDQAMGRLMPLFLQEVTQAMQEEGLEGALKTAPAALGLGVQTYSTTRDMQNQVAQEIYGKTYRDLVAADQNVVNADQRVVAKEAEFTSSGKDYVSAIEETDAWRENTEQVLAGSLANGMMSPKDFADALADTQLRSRARKEEAARNFGVTFPEPDSPLQKALDDYYNLFEMADHGFNPENPEQSVVTGAINWEVFDQLEKEYLESLTPEQKTFVDGRRRAEHSDPLVARFYENKDYITKSGYYDAIDAAFTRYRALANVVVPGATSINDLYEISNIARYEGNVLRQKQVDRVIRKISSQADKDKERLRKRDEKLDLALYLTGRTTTFQNSKLKGLTNIASYTNVNSTGNN
jgi:hypothetical protein